jgi:glycosyltransferase involved in cell wall biosynthesis
MRVHIVATRADRFGGAEVYTTGLARALAALGHDVTIICHEPGPDEDRPYAVATIPRREFAGPVVWRFAHWARWLAYRGPVQSLPLEPPDVIVAMAHLLSSWYWKRYPATPLIYLPHSLVAPTEVASYFPPGSMQIGISTPLWKRLEREALQHAACTVRFSAFGKRALEQYYGEQQARRIVVWPPPVDVPGQLAPRITDAEKGTRLLYVGRIARTKNIELTLDALSALPSGTRWQFDIVGDGEWLPVLRAIVADTPTLHGRVHFHGRQADVGPFYKNAQLLVFPSFLESAGLVVVEAMSYGVPALVIRSDGVKYRTASADFIEDGRTGFVAEDEAHFRRLLAEFAGAPARLDATGQAARNVALEQHTWRHHSDLWKELLARVGSAAVGEAPRRAQVMGVSAR